MRPILRKYEIPFLCNSSVDKKFQVSINDLLVSIVGDEVVIWSKKLNKRIIPRISNAHNFRISSLPIYRFLGDVQNDSIIDGLGWDWGIYSSCEFLPRISYNKIIICRAIWNIDVDMINNYNSKD